MIKKTYKTINNFFIFAAVLLLGYLIWDTVNTKPYIYSSPMLKNIRMNTKLKNKEKEKLKPLSYYLDRINKRNIFLPKNAVIRKVAEKKPEKPKIPISTMVRDFKVVGFSFENPVTVMIEDRQSGRTHFLREGDPVDDKLMVKSILTDGVIITNGDEDIKLK